MWEYISIDRNIRYIHRKWNTEGERAGRGCSCGKKCLQIETVGKSTEQIAHRGGEGREGVQLWEEISTDIDSRYIHRANSTQRGRGEGEVAVVGRNVYR